MKQLLEKFLLVISAEEAKNKKTTTPLGKKALEQLRYFLEDLKDASYRTLQLDAEVIPILTDFLYKCDESKQTAVLCSLDWLNHFIDFFGEDFLTVLDRARAVHKGNSRAQEINEANPLGIQEETKE